MAENLTLSPKQRRAIEALLTTGNVTEAAAAARVSRETLYKWQRQPTFAAALKEATDAALENLSRALVSLGDQAAGVLGDILGDNRAKDADRLRAAEIVLGNVLRLREALELEERLKAIEARLGVTK